MRKRKIKVDDFELRVIVKALNELRNQLIAENKPIDDLDIILLLTSFDRIALQQNKE